MKKLAHLLTLWFLIAAQAALAEPPVKKSTSGICHDSLSPSYNATKYFVAFETLDACIQAGGRLPKNRAHTRQQVESKPTSVVKNQAPVTADEQDNRVARDWRSPAIARWALAGLVGLSVVIYLIRSRKKKKIDRADEERAIRAWSAHRLESSDDYVFKRRYHRWDPWLKRIGYFDKDHKKK